MSDKSKRGRFQIYLSTAVLLMFVAGGLLWANLVIRNNGPEHYRPFFMGWPFAFAFERYRFTGGNPASVDFGHYEWHSNPFAFIANTSICGFIIIAVAYLMERHSRYREAQKLTGEEDGRNISASVYLPVLISLLTVLAIAILWVLWVTR